MKSLVGLSVGFFASFPEFVPTVEDPVPSSSSEQKLSTGMIIGLAIVGSIALLLLAFFYHRRRNVKRHSATEVDDLKKLDSKVPIFSLDEIRNATRNFHDENKLGQGAYGGVYKGILPNNKPAAVKLLLPDSRHGKRQFMTEVATISAVRHRNLVKLYGCCIEADQRILVYEYLENNSLDRALFGHQIPPEKLDWPIRYNICIGLAKGLAYLHEESDTKIIHRDVKASNILLHASVNPKISAFGLAKLFQPKDTHVSTRVAGTIGYLAPKYAMRGHLTEKADVFSFGVVSLEIVSGRRNEDTTLIADKSYLLEWTWNLYEEGRAMEIMDPVLMPNFSEEEVVRVIGVALLCTQALPTMRPSMSQVVTMLTNVSQPIAAATRPSYLTDFQYQISLNKFSEMPQEETRSSNALLTPSVVNSITGEGR